jgi:methionyl-tRNA synthetase
VTEQQSAVSSQQSAVSSQEAPAQPSYITIDDFMKVELRVANVVEAERLPNSDKLLKLTVDLGGEQRTVLAGIAEMYQPEEVAGKQVVVVANLAPRKMRGVESQGMLLAADADGQAILLQPETQVPSGTRVR